MGTMRLETYNYLFRAGRTCVKLYMSCLGSVAPGVDTKATAAAMCETVARRALQRTTAAR